MGLAKFERGKIVGDDAVLYRDMRRTQEKNGDDVPVRAYR